jgi:DNA-binding NarL/FixJ family response regulator
MFTALSVDDTWCLSLAADARVRAYGIEAIHDQKPREPEIRVLMITHNKAGVHVRENLRAGASGYISKGATQDELRSALRTTLNGKTYLSPGVMSRRHVGRVRCRYWRG